MPIISAVPCATLSGLAPVIDAGIRTLVLGSFPGAASLAAQQYYAHPRNQLWRLLSALTGEDLAALPYAQRLPRLLAHRIGLWDVLQACERRGSLDANIRNPAANDFVRLRELCPQLTTVGFNGQTSGKFAPGFAAAGFTTLILPSSSPAYAVLGFEQKLLLWRQLPLSNFGFILSVTDKDILRIDESYGIAYGDNIDLALAILNKIVLEEARILTDPAPLIKVDSLGVNAVNILFRVWTARLDNWDTKLDLVQRCKEALEAGGCTFPFPQTDTHVYHQTSDAPAGLLSKKP